MLGHCSSLLATRSLPVTARSVRILLECFLVDYTIIVSVISTTLRKCNYPPEFFFFIKNFHFGILLTVLIEDISSFMFDYQRPKGKLCKVYSPRVRNLKLLSLILNWCKKYEPQVVTARKRSFYPYTLPWIPAMGPTPAPLLLTSGGHPRIPVQTFSVEDLPLSPPVLTYIGGH